LSRFKEWIGLIAALGVLIAWIDMRYMHRDISNHRHILTQLSIVETKLDTYHRMIDHGETLTAREQTDYELARLEKQALITERNKLMDIGEDDQ
jgi:hypothetical protein